MELTRFEIKGRLPGMNDFIAAMNRHRFVGAKLKKEETERCAYEIAAQGVRPVRRPVRIHFHWTERDLRRDLDNIVAGGCKVILDGMVIAGVLKNDTRRWVVGFTHSFPEPDPDNPKVVVIMEPA